ncbi:toll-like receptor 3 [Macrobrachium nipponense]|uniref:toll-like receptor 3 n=1 Tax=Macrobrachium nipponense TaxID=159736 RepID=UPI0030C7AA96
MECDTTPLLLVCPHASQSDESEATTPRGTSEKFIDVVGSNSCSNNNNNNNNNNLRVSASSSEDPPPPCDHAQERRKLFPRIGFPSFFTGRTSSDNNPKMAEGVLKSRETNSFFSFAWVRSKAGASRIIGNSKRRTSGGGSRPPKKHGRTSKNSDESPALLTPEPGKRRRKHRSRVADLRSNCKTAYDEQQESPEGCEKENASNKPRTWVSPPSWSSVVHGLRSVALVLMVTLLSPVGAFCPRGCSCDDVRLSVQCVNADLDVIPILLHPGTLELNLSHNRIKTILEGLIFYSELQYLDLSHNEIVSLGSQNFASQRALNTLVINNNKISRIQSRAFLGLSNLSHLDLSDNYIESIEKNAFSSLGKLRSLDLSNNRIKNLTVSTFMKLRGLKVLNLCKNALKDISSVIFEPLRELEDLDLCSNQVTTIQDFAFKNLKSLVNLKLSNNKIRHFADKAFSGLDSLRLLGLRDNAFGEVPTHVLPSIKGLEELDIGINPLTALPFGPFTHLVNLKSLHISRCLNLSFIDEGAFTSLNKLTSLVLSFNPQITTLHRDIFKPLVGLRHLVLRGNGLRGFDRSLVRPTLLQSLDLRDNNLECNCSIKWLQEAKMNNSLSLKIEDISCSGPEALKGRSLFELSEYDLECYNNVVVMASCAAATMALILLIVGVSVLYYKNCRKMKSMVHDNWPEKIVATWKDPEYEKQVEDEEYTFHSLRGIQHIPVTVI